MTPVTGPQRRYRINPVELVIFCLVTVGFGVSVYNLFRETEDFKFAALQPMSSEPTRSVRYSASGADRAPAAQKTGLNMEIPCSENPGFSMKNQECVQDQGRVIHLSPIHNPSETL